MALQDLTPQLRTRISRVEKAVGWFVIAAIIILIAGFLYYAWHTAQRKGWFVQKVLYMTCLRNATGIKPGDPVKLMGFNVGEVTKIIPNDPWSEPAYSITVYFQVRHDTNGYCGYIWSDSKVRVTSTDFFGNRSLEITKGQFGIPTLYEEGGKIIGQLKKNYRDYFPKLLTDPHQEQRIFSNETNKFKFYNHYTNTFAIYLESEESPALSEQIEWVTRVVTNNLPNIFYLTNYVADALTNIAALARNANSLISNTYPTVTNLELTTSNFNLLVSNIRPIVSNLAVITTQLTNPAGSLGDWIIPTNINHQILQTLIVLTNTLNNTDTNLTELAENLGRTLNNLADITSNLNAQVQANTNILSEISNLITNADNFIQGLKRHWLLRSAFKPPKQEPQKKTSDKK